MATAKKKAAPKKAAATDKAKAAAAKKREEERKAKAAQREKEKQEKAAAREKAKKEREAAKQAEKEAKAAEREASRMPMQNGVRRPKPGTKCGRVWELADEMTKAKGSPVAIGNLLPACEAEGLNSANVRCEYAGWRKFNGVTGRIPKVTDDAA